MSHAFIGIGASGSGKSTAFKEALALLDKSISARICYICPDDIRFALTGDESDQTQNEWVWDIIYKLISYCLRNGRSVVIDATNAKPQDRQRLIDHCRHAGSQMTVGVYFDMPLELCLERNGWRVKQVPDYAIERMWNSLQLHPPNKAEGFDEIITFNC